MLINTAFANVTTSFLWFAMTYWIYLETRNVIVTGLVGGAYLLFVSIFSMFFGALVDRYRKKTVMVAATVVVLVVFGLDGAFFFIVGEELVADVTRPWFWIFAGVMLAGAVVEQLRTIALPTTVTLLVPEPRRANANGMVGTVQGLAMLATSALSGLAVGQLGMGLTILLSLMLMTFSLAHLLVVRIPEPRVLRAEGQARWIDITGGFRMVAAVPGLLTLVLFTTLNNLEDGVYTALMDPYGLELFSVEMYGIWLAVASTGFILGGLVVAKVGLGRNPIRTMLLTVALIGAVGAVMTLREWSWLFVLAIWVYMALLPVVEAAEQTVIQKVTPYDKQGRVFGFAMTFEAAAAPIASFLVAPIAELWVIPQLRTGEVQQQWAWLLGEGQARGIGLVFVLTGLITLLIALGGFLLPAFRRLSAQVAATTAGSATVESVQDVAQGPTEARGPAQGRRPV